MPTARANHLWTGPATEGRLTPSLPSSIMFLSAVWLGFAPFALDYSASTTAETSDVLVAAIAGTLALIRVLAPRDLPWLSLINAGLGAWLIVAAFAFDEPGQNPAVVNDLLIGVVLLVLGLASATMTYRQRAAERDGEQPSVR
ncbi:SPW repeat domain-containing protein [Prauserella cavernicola]|uniref:SPW repeat protein n=1 Tax=Prauserella cavernicola TaxID=2800127 RepID=A0A934V4M5_9PSEU|nr:SPW repeat protein [Prauserella cavernicola]MBK1784869.1 SPW repeat protein [Prauserella cavernicola]